MEKYNFNNKSIFYDMNHLMFGYTGPESIDEPLFETKYAEFLELYKEDRINFIIENLRELLIYKLLVYTNRKKEELDKLSLDDLVKLINDLALQEDDVWQIIHYLLNVVSQFQAYYIIVADDTHSLEPSINHDLREIEINNNTRAIEVYDFIMKNLFNPAYLLDSNLKK